MPSPISKLHLRDVTAYTTLLAVSVFILTIFLSVCPVEIYLCVRCKCLEKQFCHDGCHDVFQNKVHKSVYSIMFKFALMLKNNLCYLHKKGANLNIYLYL